jgi:hypothetical protein
MLRADMAAVRDPHITSAFDGVTAQFRSALVHRRIDFVESLRACAALTPHALVLVQPSPAVGAIMAQRSMQEPMLDLHLLLCDSLDVFDPASEVNLRSSESCVCIAERLYTGTEPNEKLIKALICRGNALKSLKLRLDEMMTSFNESVRLAEQLLSRSDGYQHTLLLALALRRRGHAYLSAEPKQLSEALADVKRSITLVQPLFEASGDATSEAVSSLAASEVMYGEVLLAQFESPETAVAPGDVLGCFTRGIDRFRSIHGERELRDHPDLAGAMSKLGNCFVKLFPADEGRLREAQVLHRDALAMRLRLHDVSPHPAVLASLGNLAGVLEQLKDYAGAHVQYEMMVKLLTSMGESSATRLAKVKANLNRVAALCVPNQQPLAPIADADHSPDEARRLVSPAELSIDSTLSFPQQLLSVLREALQHCLRLLNGMSG